MSTKPNFAVITFNGSYHTLIGNADALYDTIPFGEIVRRATAPTARAKKNAPAIIPSSYREHDARAHSAQHEKGLFHLLCADIDKGSPSLDDVRAAVQGVLGPDVVLLPHSKENRARFQLKVEPDFSSEPTLFLSILDDAFFDLEDETHGEDQKRLVRQMFGAAILGLQHGLQRAVFLYGASGSGKSVVLRILEALFDTQDVTVVSPHELDQDYKKAMLAHKRLNIVPELDADIRASIR